LPLTTNGTSLFEGKTLPSIQLSWMNGCYTGACPGAVSMPGCGDILGLRIFHAEIRLQK
jgi:hypothetical protein